MEKLVWPPWVGYHYEVILQATAMKAIQRASFISVVAILSITIQARAERPTVLLVKPVILCDDDGKNPARHALPKTLVDQVYTKGDLEFLYLPPAHWHFGKARRGEVNLDAIVEQGHANGMIARAPKIATLLFVSAVDGKTQPLGRGLQGGNICFVNLGAPDKMADPAERAFVVAHEVGHCLGMIHAVDDLKVPNDVPNLQGDGPFAERLAIDGLHPSQVKTLRCSPLVLPRLQFYGRQETTKLICEDSWDLPLNLLPPDNLRFEVGLAPNTDLPKNAEESLTYIKEKYAELSSEFTDKDKTQLTNWVTRLNDLTSETWPMISAIPWHFAKMQPTFCKGRPHTRGLAIVLTEGALERFRKNETQAFSILLHEKLHVIQRLMPYAFEAAFKRYGYQSITLPSDTVQRFNFVRNPDAPTSKWAIRHQEQLLLLATSLRHKGDDFEFVEKAYPTDGQSLGDPLEDSNILDHWRAGFPIPTGHDHPNEVSAYLLGQLFMADLLDKPSLLTRVQRDLLKQERPFFVEMLSVPITE